MAFNKSKKLLNRETDGLSELQTLTAYATLPNFRQLVTMVVSRAIPLLFVLAALLPDGTSKRLPSIEVLAREDLLQLKITALQLRMVALYDEYEAATRPNTTTTATTTTTRDQTLANARLKAFVEGKVGYLFLISSARFF